MATRPLQLSVNIEPGNGLLPDDTRSLPDLMLTCCQLDSFEHNPVKLEPNTTCSFQENVLGPCVYLIYALM